MSDREDLGEGLSIQPLQQGTKDRHKKPSKHHHGRSSSGSQHRDQKRHQHPGGEKRERRKSRERERDLDRRVDRTYDSRPNDLARPSDLDRRSRRSPGGQRSPRVHRHREGGSSPRRQKHEGEGRRLGSRDRRDGGRRREERRTEGRSREFDMRRLGPIPVSSRHQGSPDGGRKGLEERSKGHKGTEGGSQGERERSRSPLSRSPRRPLEAGELEPQQQEVVELDSSPPVYMDLDGGTPTQDEREDEQEKSSSTGQGQTNATGSKRNSPGEESKTSEHSAGKREGSMTDEEEKAGEGEGEGEESGEQESSGEQEEEESESEAEGDEESREGEDDSSEEEEGGSSLAGGEQKIDRPQTQRRSKFESVSSAASESEVEERSDSEEAESSSGDGASRNRSNSGGSDPEEHDVLDSEEEERSPSPPQLPPYFPAIQGCRNVAEFKCLNKIEEGTYGVVYRAEDLKMKEIVALKRLKMEKEKEGFPITSLREINTCLKAQHENIVTIREIVVGSNMDKIYLVMDYVEHDLKALMETMKSEFLIGEVKTLLHQLLRGVAHLHDNWILHRDLKTSNLLLSHKGVLKIADFGLAREYGSPLKNYTPVVVTLWYRAPELLLGTRQYSTAIDMWSVGCIFAEMVLMKPLWPGKSEIDELQRIFKDLGTPTEAIWKGVTQLPYLKKCTFAEYPYNDLKSKFGSKLTESGLNLLNSCLTYDPEKRLKADAARRSSYFQEEPLPVRPSDFPTWPAKSEQEGGRRKRDPTPKPPSGGGAFKDLGGDDDLGFSMQSRPTGVSAADNVGFSLKF